MTKRQKVLAKTKLCDRHLRYLINGERNASPKTAAILERVTGIGKGVWVFSSKRERSAAWKKYIKGEKQ